MRTIAALVSLPLVIGYESAAIAGVHPEGSGPLSAMSGSGGFIADAPVARPYWISFGTDTPCRETRPERTTDPALTADTLKLVRVRPQDRRFPAAKIEVFLRRVTPRQIRNHRGTRIEYLPFIALRGHPLRNLPYGSAMPGRYSRSIAGHTVRRSCADLERDMARLSRGRVPRTPIVTLVFAVKTMDKRALVDRTLIDYEVNGVPRTLRINWKMGARAPSTADPRT